MYEWVLEYTGTSFGKRENQSESTQLRNDNQQIETRVPRGLVWTNLLMSSKLKQEITSRIDATAKVSALRRIWMSNTLCHSICLNEDCYKFLELLRLIKYGFIGSISRIFIIKMVSRTCLYDSAICHENPWQDNSLSHPLCWNDRKNSSGKMNSNFQVLWAVDFCMTVVWDAGLQSKVSTKKAKWKT